MQDLVTIVQNRVSSPKLTEPGPTTEQLHELLKCALRAPDHARLKPWRYWVVQGDERIRLGELFAEALLASEPDAPEDKVEKHRNMPLRAPVLIVATCEPKENPKVPRMEQILSVGAGIQNLQLAATALGYGSIWRTGEMAHADKVKQAFDVPENGELVGFIYLGTPERPGKVPELDQSEFVKEWKG